MMPFLFNQAADASELVLLMKRLMYSVSALPVLLDS